MSIAVAAFNVAEVVVAVAVGLVIGVSLGAVVWKFILGPLLDWIDV